MPCKHIAAVKKRILESFDSRLEKKESPSTINYKTLVLSSDEKEVYKVVRAAYGKTPMWKDKVVSILNPDAQRDSKLVRLGKNNANLRGNGLEHRSVEHISRTLQQLIEKEVIRQVEGRLVPEKWLWMD